MSGHFVVNVTSIECNAFEFLSLFLSFTLLVLGKHCRSMCDDKNGYMCSYNLINYASVMVENFIPNYLNIEQDLRTLWQPRTERKFFFSLFLLLHSFYFSFIRKALYLSGDSNSKLVKCSPLPDFRLMCTKHSITISLGWLCLTTSSAVSFSTGFFIEGVHTNPYYFHL